MSDPVLILRPAKLARAGVSGRCGDYDVFDGDQNVGRIHMIDGRVGRETWFWGVSFAPTPEANYGQLKSLKDAETAFHADYSIWKRSVTNAAVPG